MNTSAHKRIRIFLLDSLGAITSAIILGVGWVKYEHCMGISHKIVKPLSLIACVFATFSFTSFVLIKKNWKPYLKTIAFANLIYCCITALFVIYYYTMLTRLSLLYFLSEIAVVLVLVSFELKMAYK